MPRATEPSLIEARARGAARYLSTRPCTNAGHVGERFTSSSSCCVCAGVGAERVKRKTKSNQQQVAALRKADDALAQLTPKRIANAVNGYAKSAEAHERSDYLDKLVRRTA